MQQNSSTPVDSQGKTILVVDDYASVRFYHANLFRQAGYKTLEARDGNEALEKVRQNRIDLILLDLIMPKMGGAEFTRRLRSTPEFANIPLLIVSSEAAEEKIRPIAGSGRFGFAIKPLVPSVLLESVRKLLA